MPHLLGDRITLREYRMEDLPHIRYWANDPEITRTLSDIFIFPQTLPDSENFLKMMVEGKPDSKGFVISEKKTSAYIGQIDLHAIDWKNRSATLGIVIGKKELLGLGYGSEAIRLIQKYVFHSLNLHRLHLDVYEFNVRGCQCYLKCGFVEEGRLRQRLFRDGQYWDVIQMSILKDEWERTVGPVGLGKA